MSGPDATTGRTGAGPPGSGAGRGGDAGFEKVRRSSAAADAARGIQQMIVDGRLTPGQRLPAERELCELLGISRPTLRETIRSLVGLNILQPLTFATL